MNKRFLFINFCIIASVFFASCTKDLCVDPDWGPEKSIISNNLEEDTSANFYFSSKASIIDLRLRPHSHFDLGDMKFSHCDSVLVSFSDGRCIHLYRSSLMLGEKENLERENCLQEYISFSQEHPLLYTLSIDYKMKSFAK